jgi:hypothetical protein
MRTNVLALLSVVLLACSGAGSGGLGSGGTHFTFGDGGACPEGGACSDFASEPDAGNGSPTTGGNFGFGDGDGGGISLTVDSTASPASVNGFDPSPGDTFLVVTLTLKNTGTSEPLSMAPSLFSLKTSQGVVIQASLDSPDSACDGSLSVTPGGEDQCAVAFQVPSGQTPALLLYYYGASAPIP